MWEIRSSRADLVVPAPAGVQLARRHADELMQAALVSCVDVLVRRLDLKDAIAPLVTAGYVARGVPIQRSVS